MIPIPPHYIAPLVVLGARALGKAIRDYNNNKSK